VWLRRRAASCRNYAANPPGWRLKLPSVDSGTVEIDADDEPLVMMMQKAAPFINILYVVLVFITVC